MQIDGHHTATYVAARLAGFPFLDAEKIAYAAQYVDDATNGGIIQFSDSPYLYARVASAHKMIDYNNLVDVENHLAWIPFHFLPGNGGYAAGVDPSDLDETDRLTCSPDSSVARDMLRYAFHDRDRPRGLHRLGIAMHVYADTFAHQGFVGAMSIANQATKLTSGDYALDTQIKSTTQEELWTAIKKGPKAMWQLTTKAVAVMVRERRVPTEYFHALLKKSPVGHAAADVYPDQPYLRWQYIDHRGQLIQRDNPAIFSEAFEMMVRAMQAWQSGDASMRLECQPGLADTDAAAARHLFETLTSINGEERRQEWLNAIADGKFSFGKEVPSYLAKGEGSWKEHALGTLKTTDSGLERYTYSKKFLVSDWKLFHDAIQAHRRDVVHEILPSYGICAA